MARILAIHAHPDDVEILAGGTLALLSEAGHHITIATMTAGDCGSAEHSAEEIAAIRRREATESAGLIGADYHCAGFFDLVIFNDDSARRRVTEVLRQFSPDIVLTASPVDYMADHENTSALVRDACFAASVPLYGTGAGNAAPPLKAIPHLYFMNPLDTSQWTSKLPPPDFCVDVGAAFVRKSEMLARHASQRNWLLKQHGIDEYLEQMRQWTLECGKRWGVELGEEFRLYRGHPYPQSPLLERLLGDTVLRK